ncbi:hypothetical protein M0R19_01820 [Candidatus Pacearchaeota archaeon]|jgi:hypothetical protein|nr:hypothetical protein [Candidatus Pacearchaeota archaeon]
MKEECCPKFNPKKWNEKTFIWKNKSFIKETIPTLFHIPFPPMIGNKITKMMKLISNSNNLDSKKDEILILFRDLNAFKSEIYISVTDNVSGANNVTLSGTFIAKTYDGGYNAVPKFVKDMNEYLAQKGKKAKNSDYYIHYAYCPKCAKKFGNNYMILFAKVKNI